MCSSLVYKVLDLLVSTIMEVKFWLLRHTILKDIQEKFWKLKWRYDELCVCTDTYAHTHVYKNTCFCATAYKLPTSKEGKDICLRYTPHLCAIVTVEIYKKKITSPNSLKPLSITNLRYFQFTKTNKKTPPDYREVSLVTWVSKQVPEIRDPKIKWRCAIW